MNDDRKLTTEEAEKLKADLEAAYPGKKFKFNPGVVELKPLVYEMESVMEAAIKRLTDSGSNEAVIVFPVNEPQTTKKNKIRFDSKDRTSPMGMVMRSDKYALSKYAPYVPAEFKARELLAWAATRLAQEEERAGVTSGV